MYHDDHSESTNTVSDKSVCILWLKTVNARFHVCWCHTVETRREKKMSSFVSTSIKNIISKAAAEVSRRDLILDGEMQKNNKPVNSSPSL